MLAPRSLEALIMGMEGMAHTKADMRLPLGHHLADLARHSPVHLVAGMEGMPLLLDRRHRAVAQVFLGQIHTIHLRLPRTSPVVPAGHLTKGKAVAAGDGVIESTESTVEL